MIKIHTIGGNVYNNKGSYQEIQRALQDISCHFLIGKKRHDSRVIIPREAVDIIEETEMNY